MTSLNWGNIEGPKEHPQIVVMVTALVVIYDAAAY